MKILILASNPRKDLNLDREIRDLREVIEKSRNRQQFEVEDALAVRVGDLQDLLFSHEPYIVHFCGHGGGQPGLVFEGNDGGEQWVRTDALRDLFRLFSTRVGCVLLNACYSEEQANEIVNHIDYVIGMNQEIRDDAAIAFSKGFYRALGYNCSIEEAYEFGCNAIQLEITGSSIVRSTATETIRKAEVVNAVATTIIPEHLKPTLKKREGVFSRNRWKTETSRPLSQGKKEELQLELAHELIGDRSAQATSNQSRFTPGNLLVSQPIQTAPNVSRSPRSRFTGLFLGGLITCLVTAGGIYGYRYWQSSQLQQNPSRQEIELPNQLQRAEEYYEKGDVDEAVRLANMIPVGSSVHSQAQIEIASWNTSKQNFSKIKEILVKCDRKQSKDLLNTLTSSGLQKQAEDLIRENEIKCPTHSEPTPDSRDSSEDPRPKPKDNPPIAPSPPDWSSYKYSWMSERPVEEKDLVSKSALELDILRNSVHAKYRRIFSTRPDLTEEFSKYGWYYPPTNPDTSNLLTSQERKNSQSVCQFQKRQNLTLSLKLHVIRKAGGKINTS